MQKNTVGRAVSRLLADYGVTQIFGIPGVHNVELFRDIEEAGMKAVLPRHEQGAGFMADGYARATGKPGVAFVITGPGLLNILTPMGQAYSDSVPMLVISSTLSRGDEGKGRGCLHEMRDQGGAGASASAWSEIADTEQDLQDLIARAFSLFASARPRPVHIDVPLDLIKSDSNFTYRAVTLPTRAQPGANLLDQAAALLSKAKRPLIVAGGGAAGASKDLIALADKIGAAVVTSISGKGIVPEDHPRSLGATMPQKSTQTFMESADVVLAVGTEFAETDMFAETIPTLQRVIRIDLDSLSLAGQMRAEISIQADAAISVEGILARLKGNHEGIGLDEIAKLRATARAAAVKSYPELEGVIDTLRAALPRDAQLVSDMTLAAYFANEVFPVYQPASLFHPVGFGTLGYALPAGIGAVFADNGRPSCVLVGDYGFQYTLPELGVAVEHELTLPIVVWNNSALGAIERDMIRKGIKPVAIKARNPDFVAVAKGYGAQAVKPKSLKEFDAAVKAALKHKGPTVIEMTPEAAH